MVPADLVVLLVALALITGYGLGYCVCFVVHGLFWSWFDSPKPPEPEEREE